MYIQILYTCIIYVRKYYTHVYIYIYIYIYQRNHLSTLLV